MTEDPYGQHMLLATSCLGGHQPVVAWVLGGLGGYFDEQKAVEGACRSGNDTLLRWLVEERHVDPILYIPSDENPASRGNLEMCQWLAEHCTGSWWLAGAGRNDHRHILEWAIRERRAGNVLVWPGLLCLAHCPPRTPQADGAAAAGRLDTLAWLRGQLGGDPTALVWHNDLLGGSRGWPTGSGGVACSTGATNATSFTLTGPPGVGNVDVVALLWKRVVLDQSQHTKLVIASARSGSLPMLQWAVDHELAPGC